jgi:hypothetical protein
MEPSKPPFLCSRKRAAAATKQAVERAVHDFRPEGVDAPGLGVADRHHVGVAGEAEVGAAGAEAGVEVVDLGRPRLGKRQPVAG